MNALNRLLDAAQRNCDPPTVVALKDRLGVSRQTLYDWRAGERTPIDEHLAHLIEIAQADASEAVLVRKESAKSAHERAMWRSLARQLGAAATLAVAALLPIRASADAGRGPNPGTQPEAAHEVGIMRNRRRRALNGLNRLCTALFGMMRRHGTPPLLA